MGSLAERKELRACKSTLVSDCGLTLTDVQALQGNPAGVGKADEINPYYKGKVTYKSGALTINLKYVLTGNIHRAEAALDNIRRLYSKAKITVNLTPSPSHFDIRIHGSTLAEIAQGLRLCDCTGALYIGGWGPSHRHPLWGNALLVNPFTPKKYWLMSDAHEFGHKLGLKHRKDRGLMDYPPANPNAPDLRKFLPSDRQRIIDLYK